METRSVKYQPEQKNICYPFINGHRREKRVWQNRCSSLQWRAFNAAPDMMTLLTCRQKDLVTGTDRATMVRHKAKMDQNSEEGVVHSIPRASDQHLCPVIKLEKWRRRREVGLGLDKALFPTARDKTKACHTSLKHR